MKKTRFSVIMPLYNKAPFVRKALQSIASQTYRDFELIIIDDGSIDNSAAICEEFFQTFNHSLAHSINVNRSFVHSFIRQTNSGVAAARNRGVAESHGEFVCFLDADDWWEPNYLEEMDKLIADYPDAGIYATNYIYYKPGKTKVALDLPRGYMNYPEAYMQGPMPIWTGATCMPRKVFDEMGGFPVGIKLGEDFLLWAKTALHYKVAFCDNPLAYYNNDVPASLRATRNLHAPEHNMLFHLDAIELELNHQSEILNHKLADWQLLLDKLRVIGLIDYWISKEYHEAAVEELKKVDWGKQPKSVMRMYKTPIWVLKVKRRFMLIGSFWKQKLLRMCKV